MDIEESHARWDWKCAICGAFFHLSPECLPCPEGYTHCIRRGPADGHDCRFDHDRPGGMFYRDPATGKSPLDIANERERARS